MLIYDNNINILQMEIFKVIPTFTAICMMKIGSSPQSYPHFFGKVIPIFSGYPCTISFVRIPSFTNVTNIIKLFGIGSFDFRNIEQPIWLILNSQALKSELLNSLNSERK